MMNKVLTIIFCVVSLTWLSEIQASDLLPPPFEATFSLRIKGVQFGQMKRTHRVMPGGEHVYTSSTRTTGLARLLYKDSITEKSTWMFEDQVIKPISYYYDRSGGKKQREVSVDFNYTDNKILTTVNGESWQMPLQGRIFDKLLYQLAIMKDLSLTQADIAYDIADGGTIKNYFFKYLGEENIDTQLGNFNTIKMIRHKPNERRQTTFWCAKELNYLPIKVENIEDDGRKTTAIIQSLSGIEL